MSTNWQSSAPINNIKLRAILLAKIRDFFAARNVLEVETPLLSHSTNPAPHLDSFSINLKLFDKPKTYYLQTSPEFAMKRLLAAGSGDIFQICKAFRNGEFGRLHNPEFTILEWYRVGFTHHDLMREMSEFLSCTLEVDSAQRFSYQEIFAMHLDFNPLDADLEQIRSLAKKIDLNIPDLSDERDTLLQLIFSQIIEPKLGDIAPTIIYDFPKSQAMLARINSDKKTAARFEVYFRGVELANGFYELNNPDEQHQRFLADLEKRKALNLPSIPLDELFLEALPHLPDCSGVAVGIDRLMLLAAQANSFSEIISFPFDKA